MSGGSSSTSSSSIPSPAGTSGLAKGDMPPPPPPHSQQTPCPFLLLQIRIRSRVLFPCYTFSWYIDASSSSSGHVQKKSSNLDIQTDCLFLHPPKRDVQADRVVPKCTLDLGNRASSSVNELKIPD